MTQSDVYPAGDGTTRTITKFENKNAALQPVETRFVPFKNCAGRLENFVVDGKRCVGERMSNVVAAFNFRDGVDPHWP